MPNPALSPASPCIAVCRLDESSTCTGCYRTLDEIRGWRHMNDEQRHALLAALTLRVAGAGNGQ